MSVLSFKPSLEEESIDRDLARLLAEGALRDPDMEGRIGRLRERFHAFAGRCSAPEWAPGLIVTDEIRRITDQYLPMDEIRPAFGRLFRLALRLPWRPASSTIHRADSWPDALEALHPRMDTADPSAILRGLMDDATERRALIFANFLPRHHGEAFGRYPQQLSFLGEWLRKRLGRLQPPLRLLDAACGTGEGTWELAQLLRDLGYIPGDVSVTGASIEPVELFAAAHAFFPHDASRQKGFSQIIAPLVETGWLERMDFKQEDIRRMEDAGEFDVILCNGILGGPLLHLEEELATSASALARRLKPGGILLATDRFHGGWKKMVPQSMLAGVLERQGLRPVPIDDGIAAKRL